MKNKIIQGNALEILQTLPAESMNCCVTSPPYWQLRDYEIESTLWPDISFSPMPGLPEISIHETECCYGLESNILSYIGHTVQVFREVKRVLKNDGTLWLNIGDTYCTSGGYGHDTGLNQKYSGNGRKRNRIKSNGIKIKDMYGLPWRIAFALQAAGWYLRQDIIEKQIWFCPDCGHEMIIDRVNDNDVIWSKSSPTPEPMMIDRCVKAHEYIFLFSKSKKYYFDSLTIAEEYKESTKTTWNINSNNNSKYKTGNDKKIKGKKQGSFQKVRKPGKYNKAPKKSVWIIAGANFSEAHFATFPERLIIPCIQAGCPVDGIVLDPFGGAGTTALVARKLNRNYLLIEIKPEYVQMTKDRLRKEIPLFA